MAAKHIAHRAGSIADFMFGLLDGASTRPVFALIYLVEGYRSMSGGTQPNVLLIMADQHRWDCLGAAGNTEVETPNLDRLAAEGVRYSNAFCVYPVCTPSRYSMLSGCYPHQHRGYTNHSTPLPETPMFPEILKRNGYSTKAIGKMHFTPTYLDVGFSEMVLAEQDGPGRWDDDYHRYLREEGLCDVNDLEDQRTEYRGKARPEYWEHFGALASNLDEPHYSTTWIADRAVETLRGWAGLGNLLMVSFIKPHHPFDPPANWLAKYDPDKLSLLPGWTDECLPQDLAYGRSYFPNEKLTEGALRRVMAAYYATISEIDFHIGRFLDVLRQKGLYDDTIILYMSDHGEYLGFHHMLLKGGHMYEPTVRIPILVKYAGGGGGGKIDDKLVSNIDIAPTLLEQCGLPRPAEMRGLHLTEGNGHSVVFCEAREGQSVMARDGRYKLIQGSKGTDLMLFDLESDPYELKNLAQEPASKEIVARLSQSIREWRPSPPPPPFLDECAIDIQQPNVVWYDDGHRKDMVRYYSDAMAKAKRS